LRPDAARRHREVLLFLRAFVGEEEVRLVLHDGSAQGAAVLIAVVFRLVGALGHVLLLVEQDLRVLLGGDPGGPEEEQRGALHPTWSRRSAPLPSRGRTPPCSSTSRS